MKLYKFIDGKVGVKINEGFIYCFDIIFEYTNI